ncbi:MAG TPA: hypothetical protein VIA06_05080 [Candidatus Dormibacteraeota bacterium]|nr:hypothetical protein [Candidatus Dormibacteraeota bacterium]
MSAPPRRTTSEVPQGRWDARGTVWPRNTSPRRARRDWARLESRLRDRSLPRRDRELLKEIKHWRLTLPRPRLAPVSWAAILDIARSFAEDPVRVEELARDPDHGGQVTINSLEETVIALRLERDGRLRHVVRDPRTGCGDLIEQDGCGQEWDVVTFPGRYFDRRDAERTLRRKIEEQRQDEGMIEVIANTAYLSMGQIEQVSEIIDAGRWTRYVLFGSSQRAAWGGA